MSCEVIIFISSLLQSAFCCHLMSHRTLHTTQHCPSVTGSSSLISLSRYFTGSSHPSQSCVFWPFPV